ncbi:MAG: flagellar type III secretion system pore protein FliP [Armatimonadota bacterium]|nr:flagellar type III secretion system pore protein FliP [Armatimonadota bacterium]MDR5689456.1 flagellar type III secretion system pore protein FliP [Armatimonadota bacterium]MDR7386639.1 flagellar type III secretion system pore protein FliP [Armatimonadota bacterium]MDR7392302.1 flagellar type III secretion system pore protein FliP [Armatimonadota bacterium]MDR7396663.1 flagellar type III secretion system pore protein FliP [Armatimonadota bacterium]
MRACLVVCCVLLVAGPALSAPLPVVELRVTGSESPQQLSASLQVLLLLTVLATAPALLILMTSFTRIVIVLSLVRSAVGVPTVPPNQVVVGLALFLTLFTMAPTLDRANREGLQPYLRGELSQQAALDRTLRPLREFMLRQTRQQDLALFVSLARLPRPRTPEDVPTYVVVPAFVTSELRTAFLLGSLLFVPFLVVDMVVSSVLLSLGMLMLPPVLISLPFKLLLFVFVDGWHLVARALLLSFR